MSLPSELAKAYHESTRPFVEGGGAITTKEASMQSWRYFLECNSACSLACPSCTKGNMGETEGLKYEHQNGIMDEELMQKCIDKIKSENPEAIVFLYCNSEPWLHPRLAHCIRSVKARGLNCQISTNLNLIRNVEDVLAARPDFIIISLSGFAQDIYVRGHAGGNIERVKENMRTLAETNNRIPEDKRVKISVNYHCYDYNQHEIAPMKEYANNLGLGFFTSLARAISMENTIQFCRSKDPDATPFEIEEGRPDWSKVLPPVGQTYVDTMTHLRIPPDKAREMYKDIPKSEVCPVGAGSIFTLIRHDGLVQMCACTADRRITLGNYLDMTPDEMIEKRTGHSICAQCIKYRLNLYYMIADRDKWEP